MDNIPISKAKSEFYFRDPSFPVALRHVDASSEEQHEHDLTVTPHFHDFSELIIITGGNGIQVIDNEKYEVRSGDVFLIQGCSIHYFMEREQVDLINVMFDPSRLPMPLDWLRRLPGYNVIFELEPSVRTPITFKHRLKMKLHDMTDALRITSALEHELDSKNPGREAAAFNRLLELIIFMSRKYEAADTEKSSGIIRLGRIISRMETDFSHDWTLKELARLAGASPNSLMRHFRQATGTSPIDYLIQVRLRNASELLRTTDLAVSEISEKCGFSDSNYFSRMFSKTYGISPRLFRKES